MLIPPRFVFRGAIISAIASALTFVTPTQAMTFATGQGTDSATCGAVTSPCRTLQQAVTNEPAGGYVVLKGPADFAGAEVRKSISIVGEDGATIRAINDGLGIYAIIIQSDANAVVRLRGLTLVGTPGAHGGVTWFAGKRLEIADCTIGNFGRYGVSSQTSSGGSFSIVNTSISRTGGYGVRMAALFSAPPVRGFMDGLRLHDNVRGGLLVEARSSAVVINSSATGHRRDFGSFGFGEMGGASASLLLRNTTSSHNIVGFNEGGGGDVAMSDSAVTDNIYAAESFAAGIRTYGDNVIRGNADDTLNHFLPAPLH